MIIQSRTTGLFKMWGWGLLEVRHKEKGRVFEKGTDAGN
jgi:hypothetical protein